jgi:hypothetical protein
VQGLFDGALPSYQVQKRYEKKGGGYLWANVSASRIPAVDQDGPMLAVIVEDITAKKEASSPSPPPAPSWPGCRASPRWASWSPRSPTRSTSRSPRHHQQRRPALAGAGAAQPRRGGGGAARVSRDATLAGGVIARIRRFLRAGEIRQEWIAVPKLLDELLLMLQTVLLDAGVQVVVRIRRTSGSSPTTCSCSRSSST